jgi:hypothetical protein
VHCGSNRLRRNFALKNESGTADSFGEEQILFQLVRRAVPGTPTQYASTIVKTVTAREDFLSKSLIAVLSVNVFMLSVVVSFCAFTFWYPS